MYCSGSPHREREREIGLDTGRVTGIMSLCSQALFPAFQCCTLKKLREPGDEDRYYIVRFIFKMQSQANN